MSAENAAEEGITSRSSVSEPNIYKNKVHSKKLIKKCSFQSIRSLVKKISFNSGSNKESNSVQAKHSSYKRKKNLISTLYSTDNTDFNVETIQNEFNAICDKNGETNDSQCMYSCVPLGISRYTRWRDKVKSKSFKKTLHHFEQRVLHMKEALCELLKSVNIKRDICYEHSKIFKDRLDERIKNVESNIHFFDDLVNDCRELTYQLNTELDSLMSVTTFYNEIQRHNNKDSRKSSFMLSPEPGEKEEDETIQIAKVAAMVARPESGTKPQASDNNDVIQVPSPAQWQGFKGNKSKILAKSCDLSQAIIASGILNSVKTPRARGGVGTASRHTVVTSPTRHGIESSDTCDVQQDSRDVMITSMLNVLYDDVQLVDVALNVRKCLKMKHKVNDRLAHIMAGRDAEVSMMKKLKKIKDEIEDIQSVHLFGGNGDDALHSISISSHSLKLIPQDSATSHVTPSTTSSSSLNSDRGTDDVAAAALECIDDAHITLREERDILSKLAFLNDMIDSVSHVKTKLEQETVK